MNVTDSKRALSGAVLVVAGLAGSLGLSILWYAVMWLVPNSYRGAWPIIQEVIWWTVMGVVAIGLLQLSGAVDRPMLLRVAAVALIVNLIVEVTARVLGSMFKHELETVLSFANDASMLSALGARLLMISAMAQLTMKTSAWVVPLLGTAGLLVVIRTAVGLASLHHLLPSDLHGHFFSGFVYPMVSLLSGVALLVAAFALKGAVAGGPNTNTPALVAAAGLQPSPAQPVALIADFLVGGILLAVGVGVTMVSMAGASEGGRYVVATGAIVVGVVRTVRGLVRLGRRGS